MSPPFGVDVAGILAAELGPGMDAVTLTVVTTGERNPIALSAGTNPTTTDYECRGQVTDYAVGQIDGTLVQRGDRRVTLLARTIGGGTVVPKPGDRVTVASREYNVVRVTSTPGASHYDCQVRG